MFKPCCEPKAPAILAGADASVDGIVTAGPRAEDYTESSRA